MGFTTGLVGGMTLTYSLLYFSLHLHRLNRQQQHTMLRQQTALLNSIIEPLPVAPEQPAFEVRKPSLAETLKDRWNREVTTAVRNVEETDWRSVREQLEERASDVWKQVRG